jgi:HTH-type transcriptional regulator / antitoxin HigA
LKWWITMARVATTEYQPDYVSPPGTTLRELLEERGLPQRQLAARCGLSPKHINHVISGKAGLSADMALALEKTLGVPARFWLAREARYQEYVARQKNDQALAKHIEWVNHFPLKEMERWGYIAPTANPMQALQRLLEFFGVATPDEFHIWWDALQPSFRRSSRLDPDMYALAAWLRRGEQQAQGVRCQPFNATRFSQRLAGYRLLTFAAPEVFQPQLIQSCAECGVAVAFTPELPKTHVSGATRWLAEDKALIQLSLRYKTDDMLWFAFFHEARHVLRSLKRTTYLEDQSGSSTDEEREADEFAADMLIPRAAYSQFARQRLSEAQIRAFAESINIAPGIVVGRLQHDSYLPQTHLNGLKMRLQWEKLS